MSLLALLRHADRNRECPFIGVDRKSSADGKTALLTQLRHWPPHFSAPRCGQACSYRDLQMQDCLTP
jgi:hypothetical protein